jgi:hypothetical protein
MNLWQVTCEWPEVNIGNTDRLLITNFRLCEISRSPCGARIW